VCEKVRSTSSLLFRFFFLDSLSASFFLRFLKKKQRFFFFALVAATLCSFFPLKETESENKTYSRVFFSFSVS